MPGHWPVGDMGKRGGAVAAVAARRDGWNIKILGVVPKKLIMG